MGFKEPCPLPTSSPYLHLIFVWYQLEPVLVYVTPKTEGDRVGNRASRLGGCGSWGKGILGPSRPPALDRGWPVPPAQPLPGLSPL